ncbi:MULTISPECIES: tyrosine-type recombinase/integrase [unclassified Tolypothrix]|nr:MULTISPECIES: site-specific integrase [unclassified Tolypothrix]EKE97651.1 putative integrase [Tolypothrix sp. PCC 7601]MBE9083226.1 site-specific integrase [Tolypothrix sp. LEGE 11397]UYD23924.1 site-specific integrase [Tolypothrix sp. PCC 7712]UYD33850.1 site-specific integrase [Tolypothrix sp. PCC 7601]
MPKNNRSGKAAVINDADFVKIRKQIKTDRYKLLLDLAWYTGERWGALLQLRVSDVYDRNGRPKEVLVFPAIIRKHRPDGTADTVEIPVHENLRESLSKFDYSSNTVWLFPSRCGTKPITWRNAYDILRRATEAAGLGTKGISTHTTRRSLVNKLRKNGTDKAIIRRITGHRDNKGLDPYLEVDIDEIKGAIATL